MSELFDRDYYFGDKVRSGFDGGVYRYGHPSQQEQLSHKRREIHEPYHSILFVGCGPGYEVKYFRERGKPAYGCDISKFAIDWIKANEPAIADHCFLMDGPTLPPLGEIDVVAAFDVLTLVPADQRQELIAEMCRVAEKRIVFRTVTLCPHRHPVREDGWHGEDGALFRYEPFDYWIESFEKSGKFKLDTAVTYGHKIETVFSFVRA